MITITFKEQFDKLTRVYIENKVDPYNHCACFVGNLLNGKGEWQYIRYYRTFGESIPSDDPTWNEFIRVGQITIEDESKGMYTPEEIIHLENTFLHKLEKTMFGERVEWPSALIDIKSTRYEDALFEAFSETLEALREIHEKKGEKVDDFTFTKRQLQNA